MAEKINTNLITLTRYTLNEQKQFKDASGDMTLLLASIQLGCKFVATSVRKAGLANLTGLAGETNVQGEDQKKLDVLANDIFVNALKSSGKTCILVSEEDEKAIFVEEGLRGKYIVCFDPLDGSSNIDCGVSIGTIFGIYKIDDLTKTPTLADTLKPGSELVAAGYAMYGSSTNLVISTGGPVNGYTLDPSLGEFILTHPNIQMPDRGKIYSVNEGNISKWPKAAVEYFTQVKQPHEDGRKPYSLRYIGSMVADVHRTFLYGGLFAYPADRSAKKGKLRILYEVFPMAYLCEKAGGKASTGTHRVLDIVPQNIHERCPVYLGSAKDVEDVEAFYKKYPEDL